MTRRPCVGDLVTFAGNPTFGAGEAWRVVAVRDAPSYHSGTRVDIRPVDPRRVMLHPKSIDLGLLREYGRDAPRPPAPPEVPGPEDGDWEYGSAERRSPPCTMCKGEGVVLGFKPSNPSDCWRTPCPRCRPRETWIG